MTDWDPGLYARFEDERTRPARDLLARVLGPVPRTAWDLGCGGGNSTELLAERWPGAEVVGIDTSPAMLKAARERLPADRHPGVRFEAGDIADWQPDRPADLIYSNAALQWVGDHARLVPRLFSLLAPGGTLAVQMPDNLDEPSHRLMREVAAEGPWARAIGDAGSMREPRHPPGVYRDLLASEAAAVDLWRTVYFHPMASAAAIVDWLRATGLKPFLAPLDASQTQAFLAAYEARIDDAYPPQADGRRLLAFPRLFFVARRRG